MKSTPAKANPTEIFRQSKPKAKYLVIINKGPGSVHFSREGNDWDLMEIYFMPQDVAHIRANPEATQADYIVFDTDRASRKFNIVKRALEAGIPWQHYDAIMMADDDVVPWGCTAKQIFDLFMTTGCRIGQPAFSHHSHFYWVHTVKNDNFVWRRTNHIDYPCFLMTREGVETYLPHLDGTRSQNGLDLFWGYLEWQRGTGHAVLDSTPIYHSRPYNSGTANDGYDDSQQELTVFLMKHRIPTFPKLVLDGVLAREPSREDIIMAANFMGCPRRVFESPHFHAWVVTHLALHRYNKLSPSSVQDALEMRDVVCVEPQSEVKRLAG